MLLAIALAACGVHHSVSSSPDASSPDARDISFEFHATAGWYVGTTPNVTGMTINGQALASGAPFSVDMHFASFADGVATFTPLTVVITTTTDQRTFQLGPGVCSMISNQACMVPGATDCPEPITFEDDQFYAFPDLTGQASVDFSVDCGRCDFGHDHSEYWCT